VFGAWHFFRAGIFFGGVNSPVSITVVAMSIIIGLLIDITVVLYRIAEYSGGVGLGNIANQPISFTSDLTFHTAGNLVLVHVGARICLRHGQCSHAPISKCAEFSA